LAKKTNTTVNGKRQYRTRALIGQDENGAYKYKNFYGSSKTEAEEKKEEFLNALEMGLNVDYEKVTFTQLYEKWFKEVHSPSLSDSSIIRYEQVYRLKIKTSKEIAPKRLSNLKSIDIQTLYNRINAEYSYSAVLGVHKLVKPFITYCFKEGYITKDLIDNVKLPKNKQITDKSKPVLSKEDIAKIWGALEENRKYLIYVFALYTGLRQGEILALTHSDVDLDNQIVSVNKTVKMIKGVNQVNNVKTKSGYRDVPIFDSLMPYLKEHIKSEKEKHLKLGIPFNDNSIFFSSTTCGYRDGRNLRRGWDRLQDKLNITRIKFHGLRHTFCTLLAEQGVPLKTASMIMGHSNINITAEYYTHVDLEEKQKAINTLNNINIL
jgi:integrase